MSVAALFLTTQLTTGASAPGPAHPCHGLSQASRTELTSWLRNRYAPNDGLVGRSDVLGTPVHALSQEPTIAGACLEKIFRDGLAGSGLWVYPSPAPVPGTEALDVLGRFDKARAARLW